LYCLSLFFWPLYCLSLFLWPLYCLSLFELRLLLTHLISILCSKCDNVQ
jgi:hypothetical protein